MKQFSIASFFKVKKDTACENNVVEETKAVPQNSPTSVVEDCFIVNNNDESPEKTEKIETIDTEEHQENSVNEIEGSNEEMANATEEFDDEFRKWAEEKQKEESKPESNVERNAKNMKILVNKAVTFVEEMQKHIETNSDPTPAIKQPKSLKGGALFPHQLEAIDWLRRLFENGSHGILADEMGLGKTIEVIGLLASLREEGVFGCVLIIAPLSTLGNWMSEFQRWLPDVNVVKYHGDREQRRTLRENLKEMKDTVIITSYEMIRMDTSFFIHHNWFYLIVDEGHRLKNNESQLMQCLFTFSHSPETSRLILTGTPLQNNLKELWSLLNFLLPDIFSSVTDFLKWFDFNNSASEMIKVDIVNTLRKVISPFFLRRVKADIDIYLPPKREYVLFCGMSKFEEELYDVVCSNDDRFLQLIHTSHLHLQSKSRINRIQILRQIVSHPYNVYEEKNGKEYVTDESLIQASSKLNVLDSLLQQLIPDGHRVLIFVQFIETLHLLEDYAVFRGWKYCAIHGAITQTEREESIAKFNKDPSIPLFFLTTRSGGLGINLSTADTVVLYDSDWNPQQDIQAMDRVHRIGQKKNVAVYQLITLKSIDVHLLKIAEEKRQLERIVTHHSRSNPSLKMLSFEEFLMLYNSNQLDGESGAVPISNSAVKQVAEIHASGKIDEKGPGYRIMNRAGQGDALSSVNKNRVVAEKREKPATRRSTRAKKQRKL